MRCSLAVWSGPALALWAAASAHAQSYLSPNPPPDVIEARFRLEVDALYGTYDTRLRLDNTTLNTPGTSVSGEDDLGLDKSQFLGQVELTLLPGEHHFVRLGVLSMRRSGSHVLTRDVSWKNDTFFAGERVDSFLNLSLVGLTYGYMPFRTDRYDVAATFGLHIVDASGNVTQGTPVSFDSDSGVGALPLLGLEGHYDFTRRWSAEARFEFASASWASVFGADLKGLSAKVTDARLAVRYRPTQHLLFGLGYRRFKIEVDAPNSNPAGSVSLQLSAPLLFMQGSL